MQKYELVYKNPFKSFRLKNTAPEFRRTWRLQNKRKNRVEWGKKKKQWETEREGQERERREIIRRRERETDRDTDAARKIITAVLIEIKSRVFIKN